MTYASRLNQPQTAPLALSSPQTSRFAHAYYRRIYRFTASAGLRVNSELIRSRALHPKIRSKTLSHALALASHSLTYYQWQQPRPERHVCTCSANSAARIERLQQTKPRQKSAALSDTAYHYSVPLQNRASSCTTRRLVNGPRRRCAGCPRRRTCA